MDMQAITCIIQAGTFTRCDYTWKKTEPDLPCYKIYYVTAGNGCIIVNSQYHQLLPGNLYFISGYQIENFWCDDFMDVYWFHFMPVSLLLDIYLKKCDPFYVFPKKTVHRWQHVMKGIPETVVSDKISDSAYLYGMLMSLIADLMDTCNRTSDLFDKGRWALPAIEYMDNHWKENPPLEQIAHQVGLTANYFHNIFRNCFNITPYNYMLQKRMSIAKELVIFTDLSIKEIALKSGYACPYHFSKIYKTYHGVSPKFQRHRLNP